MSFHKYKRSGAHIRHFLNEISEQLGHESGFVKRRSKLTSTKFVQILLLGWLHNPNASLQELTRWGQELGINITPQGLDKRFHANTVEFFQKLLEVAVQHFQHQQDMPITLLSQFDGIHILDSSYVNVPDHMKDIFQGMKGRGSEALAKVQLSFDYQRGHFNALVLQSGTRPDQCSTLHLEYATPKSLHLFDLGYFKLGVFEQLMTQGAYFISRFNTQTALYACADDTKSIDLPHYVRQLKGDQHEMTLYMGAKKRLPVRVLFQRVPPDVIHQRRRRAKRTQQQTMKTRSKRYFDLLEWSIFVTNVPQEQLRFEHVFLLYRVRWQIELLFKLWKSYAQTTTVGTWRRERVLCQLYAKFIIMILFQWIVTPFRVQTEWELSYPKAFQLFRFYHFHAFVKCLKRNWRGFCQFLDDFMRDSSIYARKDKRHKRVSTFHLLQQASSALG